MSSSEWLLTAPVYHALAIGAFGGAALVLTVAFSRRGPLIFPVYGALLAGLALALSRYAALPYSTRFAAALVGYFAASTPHVVANFYFAGRERRRLRRQGILPAAGGRLAPARFTVSIGLVVALGAAVSAGVAFLAG